MNRFITIDGPPRRSECSEALLRDNPLFDKAVILLHDVVEVLHGPVPASAGQIAGPLQASDGGRVRASTQTDALGRMRKWVYENGLLSRIERYYAGVERTAERTVFTYDAYGRTQTVGYGTQRIPGVMETYEYYPSGRLFAKTLGVFGTPLRAEFTYDAEGRAYSTKYPGGTVVYVKYNEADRPKELWKDVPDIDELQASAEYDPRGLMTSMTRPGAWWQQWTYNEGGLMTGHSVGVPGNPYGGMTSVTYTYGTTAPVSGKLASATQNGNTVNYGYDSLGRLTSATSAAWNQTYTYDGFSNLYQKTGSTGR